MRGVLARRRKGRVSEWSPCKDVYRHTSKRLVFKSLNLVGEGEDLTAKTRRMIRNALPLLSPSRLSSCGALSSPAANTESPHQRRAPACLWRVSMSRRMMSPGVRTVSDNYEHWNSCTRVPGELGTIPPFPTCSGRHSHFVGIERPLLKHPTHALHLTCIRHLETCTLHPESKTPGPTPEALSL